MSRIGLIGSNTIEYISILVDIWINENCAVLLDRNISQMKALELLKEAGVNKCFVEDRIISQWNDNLSCDITFDTYTVSSYKDCPLPDYIYKKFKENYSNEEAIIIYSSGTTGRSKGVILSFNAINTNADAIISYMKLRPKDCLYLAKPLTHSSSLTGELLVSLKTNTKIIIAPIVVPPRYIFEKVEKYNVSILCVNPTLLELLLNDYKNTTRQYRLNSLRTIYVSGAVLSDKLYNWFYDTFPEKNLFNVYGLTEASPRVTAQTVFCKKSNSVGVPILGVKVCIVDEEGNIVKGTQRGIVHVNTPSLFLNYVSGNTKHKSLYNNWLNTGDIGFWDQNKELHIIGRIDDVLFIGEHKIYPGDVEAIIINNTSIDNCVVVSSNDKHSLCCLYTGDHKLENKEFISKISNYLLPYEIPKYYFWCPSLPYNQNGKISREIAYNIVYNQMKGIYNE